MEVGLQGMILQNVQRGMDQEQDRIRALDEIGMAAQGGTLSEEEPVGDVNVGDNYNVVQPSKLLPLAVALLAFSVPAAVLAWKMLEKPVPVQQSVDTDTTTGLRIMR